MIFFSSSFSFFFSFSIFLSLLQQRKMWIGIKHRSMCPSLHTGCILISKCQGLPNYLMGLLALTVLGGSADAPSVFTSGNQRDLIHSLKHVQTGRILLFTQWAMFGLFWNATDRPHAKDLLLPSKLEHLTRTTLSKTYLKNCAFITLAAAPEQSVKSNGCFSI